MIAPQELYKNISLQLTDSEFLEFFDLDKSFVYEQVEGPSFADQIHQMVQKGDFSCQAIYSLCAPFLEKLWGPEAPKDPLYYIYQHVLSYSFPDSVEIELKAEWDRAVLFYLRILRGISKYEKFSSKKSMATRYPLSLLTKEEARYYKVSSEYYAFKKIFEDEYVYEMMKLNQDVVQYNTLDHISGVHHLALFIGKQLYDAGIPVDLGRVSGAAAGHDIGKFGCRSWEGNRVAYLHYYYTDLWFKKRNIIYIGNIALNHSTWDLELENLSVESLVLIYSDFRVKNGPNAQGDLEMKFFSLKDSFDVILNKLDNVDQAKERRYVKVYNKLKDFEDYMRHLGVETDPNRVPMPARKEKQYYALMRGSQITEHLKYLAIHHNINLMHQFRNETSLNEILEVIRSEDDPKNLREYIDVLREYSTYLTQKQKIITLKFIYEKLIHPEEDIRRQCAELIGSLIALFDEDYRKEIPEGVTLTPAEVNSFSLLDEYLKLFTNPDHKIIPLHRQWIGYNTKTLITTVFRTCNPAQIHGFKKVVLGYYSENLLYESYINIYLLDVVGHIPIENDEDSLLTIFNYIRYNYMDSDESLRIAALKAIDHLLPLIRENQGLIGQLNKLLVREEKGDTPAENYLRLKIMRSLGWDESKIDQYCYLCLDNLNEVSHVFLSNLKTATSWIIKKVQVKMLLEYSLDNKNMNGLYTAMHYCNLLKVSAVESVRNAAGKALVSLIPHLPLEQRNDIAVELLRALELESYQVTKYIPNYLGQILLYLKPIELDEVIDDVEQKIKQSNNQIKSLLLRTVGIILTTYPKYKDLFHEKPEVYMERKQKLLGILLSGLAHDDLQVKQISFSVLGKEVFGSPRLDLEEKHRIFQLIGKKVLTLLTDTEETELLFLTNSSGLNHIYRFISDYSFNYGDIHVQCPERIAFFPGSFDPFTLGHKEICRAIRDKGFEVYLAIDEFSWSKRTQPNAIRKNIVNMSVASELDIYLYPEDFPVNIANPRDLEQLKNNLNSHKVFIVVGSDVILNASAYRLAPRPCSIHEFSHIIFERRSQKEDENQNLAKALEAIQGEVVQLNIPPQYEDVSSSQIRSYIDKNRDISDLIDPLAQKYIYENNLYRREPQYKSVIQTISINVDVVTEPSEDLLENIISTFHQDFGEAYDNIKQVLQKPEGRLIIISDARDRRKLLAYGALHWLPSDQLYAEFRDIRVTNILRKKYKGRIISLDGFFANTDDNYRMYQIILTETLAYCLKNDYGYAIYHNMIHNQLNEDLLSIIRLQGFMDLPYDYKNPMFAVDMSNPCTLNLNVETGIKEPFKNSPAVREVIKKTRKRLQKTLTELYPGNLVLSFDTHIIDEIIVKKVCKENKVSSIPASPPALGPLMCVPFGNILNRAIVPNTVTKSLHVEKLFNPNMKSFTIGPYPYYLSLDNQIKMIGSFSRPVILVDDLLHKGYRIKGIDPIFKKQGVKVHKVIVGILSGRGKELMDIQNREVDSAYFIPKLRLWFNENLLYPFIGGDTLWREIYPEKNLISSINLILPYTSPYFIKGVTNRSVYNLSEISILNAMDILKVLEAEYQRINERKLTLSLLGDVFISPRYPDAGENILYDLSINPSSYLKNNLEILKRLEHSIITGDMQRSSLDEDLSLLKNKSTWF